MPQVPDEFVGRVDAAYSSNNPNHCFHINLVTDPEPHASALFPGLKVKNARDWLHERLYSEHKDLAGKRVRLTFEVLGDEHEAQ